MLLNMEFSSAYRPQSPEFRKIGPLKTMVNVSEVAYMITPGLRTSEFRSFHQR
jgi:hypothetical protein